LEVAAQERRLTATGVRVAYGAHSLTAVPVASSRQRERLQLCNEQIAAILRRQGGAVDRQKSNPAGPSGSGAWSLKAAKFRGKQQSENSKSPRLNARNIA
jgi:hypothetical protein